MNDTETSRSVRKIMLRFLATPYARAHFGEVRTLFRVLRRWTLARVPDPISFARLIDDPALPPVLRAEALAGLVVVARTRAPDGRDGARVAHTLLWICLWPELEALTARAREVGAAPGTVLSEVAAAFADTIAALDLNRLDGVLARLIAGTERRLRLDVRVARQARRRKRLPAAIVRPKASAPRFSARRAASTKYALWTIPYGW